MRKLPFLTALAVVAPLMGACAPPGGNRGSGTSITFTIDAYHQTDLDKVVPRLNVVANVDGYVPWNAGHDVPAPYRFTVDSADYPQAKFKINVVAQQIEPSPNVILTCTWSAKTPAGTRLSRDSSGGEGESHAGGPVNCKYFA